MNERAQAPSDPFWIPVTLMLIGLVGLSAWEGRYRFAAGLGVLTLAWVVLILFVSKRREILDLVDGGEGQ